MTVCTIALTMKINDKFLCIVLWNVTHNIIRYKTIIITEAEGKILEKDIALEKRKWIKKKKKNQLLGSFGVRTRDLLRVKQT